MLEFTVTKTPLENAMKLAILSTEASENTITGHCLFEVTNNEIRVLATDKRNKLSMSKIGISFEGSGKFTADPRKILKLLKTVDSDSLKIRYVEDTATLQIFLSDNQESFVSLPSFDPSDYTSIAENFEKAFDLKTVNAGSFLGGLQFIKGFLDLKNQKFSNMYITKGVMYGSNGNNKAGAFTNPDLADLDELIFPLSTFPAISSLIEILVPDKGGQSDVQDIVISTSSNHVFISSPAKDFIYAFTKVQTKMPKIPITVDEPDMDGWRINRSLLLKKINRLQLTDAKAGVQCIFTEDKVQFSTIADRSSKDFLLCSKIKDSKGATCITECRLLVESLLQFKGEEIDFFVKNKIVLFNKAEMEFLVQEQKVVKPFICAAAVSMSREAK
jgi:hypothetical protein